jgi:hypothetical protein
MAQTPLQEDFHDGGFLISEANGTRSRKRGLLSGTNFKAGHTLGLISHGAATAAASAGNTGNGTSSAVTTQANCQTGVYRAVFTAATKFEVFDPDGNMIGKGSTGVAFATEVGFTITAGGTAFVGGDGFDITVAAATAKYVEYDPAGTNGAEVLTALNYGAVDASAADKSGTVIARSAEVNASELVWKAGVTTNQKAAALAALEVLAGIVAR